VSSCGSGFAFTKRPREPADRQGAAIPMPTAVDAIERENDWLRRELANARREPQRSAGTAVPVCLVVTTVQTKTKTTLALAVAL
jgi:hypothetical protein